MQKATYRDFNDLRNQDIANPVHYGDALNVPVVPRKVSLELSTSSTPAYN